MIRLRLHNPNLLWTAAHKTPRGPVVQWPPSPWTVLAALVAGAHATNDAEPARRAIQTLAAGPDPDMWLPGVHEHRVLGVYVGKTGPQGAEKRWKLLDESRAVAGLLDRRNKHQWFTARGEWTHPCAFLDFSVELAGDEVVALAAAARATSYVGRATDCVTIGVLTPSQRGWVDHTSSDGEADAELTEPGAAHDLWQPGAGGGPVRAATTDFLQVLDLCHERRHVHGLAGLPDRVKGRPVTYTRRGGMPDESARVVLLLSGRRTQQDVLAALTGTPLLLGGETPWAVSFPSRDEATAGHLTGLFRDGEPHPRHVERYYGKPASAWESVVPTVAHPDRRIAEHEIVTGLRELGTGGNVVALRPGGPCPEFPHLARWRVRLLLDQPHPGPVRLGHGQECGYGRFRTEDGRQ